MNLAASTKISAIIKANPAAVEAIASISSHFEKLRNPLLRKILASRVSIADAARIGGCREEDFYAKLAPLGFTTAETAAPAEPAPNPVIAAAAKPAFLRQLSPEKLIKLDVREHIAAGNDPFRLIMDAVKELDETHALLLVNTFEPTPLLVILQKKGYRHFVETLGPDLVHTYFWRDKTLEPVPADVPVSVLENFDDLLAAYAGKVRRVDVRQMEMPQPMVTILGELEQLSTDEGLYVLHKRVPQYLLPQLQERGFAVSIREAGPGEVYLFIYKK